MPHGFKPMSKRALDGFLCSRVFMWTKYGITANAYYGLFMFTGVYVDKIWNHSVCILWALYVHGCLCGQNMELQRMHIMGSLCSRVFMWTKYGITANAYYGLFMFTGVYVDKIWKYSVCILFMFTGVYVDKICRVGQNRKYTLYMTVYLVDSLQKIPYMHRIYMVLANPKVMESQRMHIMGYMHRGGGARGPFCIALLQKRNLQLCTSSKQLNLCFGSCTA